VTNVVARARAAADLTKEDFIKGGRSLRAKCDAIAANCRGARRRRLSRSLRPTKAVIGEQAERIGEGRVWVCESKRTKRKLSTEYLVKLFKELRRAADK